MKKLILVVLTLSPIILFGQNNLQTELSQLIDHWHKAAAEANEDAYFKLIADDGIFIGTDSSENWTKSEFQAWAKPFFDRGKAWSLKANSRNIYVHSSKQMAWFDELLYTKSGCWIGTGVLVKEKKHWKIAHYTLSVTIPNENMKEVSKLLLKE